MLAVYEYDVSRSPDVYHALEALQSRPVDLVMTDVDMPGTRGDALLAQIRATFPEIPVIAMTAFGSVEQAVEPDPRGRGDYLAKPIRTQPLPTRFTAYSTKREHDVSRCRPAGSSASIWKA